MWRMRSARNLPFSSSASSPSVKVSRAWPSLRNASERVDIQCTGRPVSFAADQDRDVFRIGAGLEPEGAADVLGDDVQAFLRPVHDGEDVVAQRARALRAGAQRVAVGRRDRSCAVAPRGSIVATTSRWLIDFDARDVLGASDDALDLLRIGVGVFRRARPVDRDIARRFRPQLRARPGSSASRASTTGVNSS